MCDDVQAVKQALEVKDDGVQVERRWQRMHYRIGRLVVESACTISWLELLIAVGSKPTPLLMEIENIEHTTHHISNIWQLSLFPCASEMCVRLL